MNDHHHVHPGGHGPPDTTGVHGMLLFGEDPIYLSHLPMFGSPHNFQVLLDIALDDEIRKTVLSHDHVVPDEGYDTFVPQEFPIAELDPEGNGPARSSITGTIMCGHFERGGAGRRPLAADVEAVVQHVTRFSELDTNAKPEKGAELTYLCFGRAGRLYLAHQINARPSFDHLLAVRVVPGTATDQAGRPLPDDQATLETFFAEAFQVATPVQFGRGDKPGKRLTPGEVVAGSFLQKSPPSGFHGFSAQLEMERDIYVEIGELA